MLEAGHVDCGWCSPEDRIRRHHAFEEYILNEVMRLMSNKNPHPCTIAHGCSLGAYHGANIALRHPHLFRKLAAFSGRYDLTLQVADFQDLLGGYRDDLVYFHTPAHFLPNLTCPWQLDALRDMEIVLVVGQEDPFLDNNRHLGQVLREKGVRTTLHEWEGRAHQGYHWLRRHSVTLAGPSEQSCEM